MDGTVIELFISHQGHKRARLSPEHSVCRGNKRQFLIQPTPSASDCLAWIIYSAISIQPSLSVCLAITGHLFSSLSVQTCFRILWLKPPHPHPRPLSRVISVEASSATKYTLFVPSQPTLCLTVHRCTSVWSHLQNVAQLSGEDRWLVHFITTSQFLKVHPSSWQENDYTCATRSALETCSCIFQCVLADLKVKVHSGTVGTQWLFSAACFWLPVCWTALLCTARTVCFSNNHCSHTVLYHCIYICVCVSDCF